MALAQVQLPHNCDAILKEADSEIDICSDNLMEQLHSGILLNQNKLKFWVDRLLCANSFEIFARGLSITWGDDKHYWEWTCMRDKDHHAEREEAELLHVCWLEVTKKFPSENLTPRTCYQVSFVLKMKDSGRGFANHPVKLKLVIPNYNEMIERKEDLSKMPKNKWTEIRVGEFISSCNMTGDMEISMFENGSQWKSGLVVDKVIIRPVRREK